MDISLKPRMKEHVAVFWDKTQDEEIKRLFPFSIDSLEKALALFEASQKPGATSYGNVIYFEGKYIGDIWCYGIDEKNEKMAMLSIVIFEKKLWGRGIATEATGIFTEKMFDKYHIGKLGAFVYASNYGSISMLKKVGFHEIERFIEDGIESVYLEMKR